MGFMPFVFHSLAVGLLLQTVSPSAPAAAIPEDSSAGVPSHVVFLGTGAADTDVPKRHQDKNCTYVREHGGRNERRNASLFVPLNLIIDYSVKGREGLRATGVEPAAVDFILITHSHGDHFDPKSITDLAAEKQGQIVLGGNGRVVAAMREHLESLAVEPDLVLLELKAEREFDAGAWRVKPLEANHAPGEEPLLYVLRRGGRSLFYATDTTWLPASTFEALRSEKLDMVIVEATFGEAEPPDLLTAHMNLPFVRIFKRFVAEQKILNPTGTFAVTHMSLHWCEPHDLLAPKLAAEQIVLPCDGMRLDF